MKYRFLSILFLLSLGTMHAQDKTYKFTLNEAVEFAMDSSYATANARRDIAIAIKKRWETATRGLPQINADVSYTNNLKQPVQLIPGEFFGGDPGTFIPVTFGTKQQMSAVATLDQLLFDGSYIVALQASKTYLEFSENQAEKTALETRKAVIEAYGNVLLAEETVEIFEKNKKVLEDNVFETKKIYENGLTELESVEQLQITLSQVENRLNNAERMVGITKELLKLALGIELKNELILEDDLESLAQENISLTILNNEWNIQDNIDYQLAENLTEQRELELKLEKSRALPTLSAFINYGTAAYGEDFDFFESDQEWFQSSVFGVNLNIPIFSSLQRSSRTQQAKIELEKAKIQFTQTRDQIQLELKRAQSNYEFAIESYQTAQNNLELAQRIANRNEIEFGEGLATSFELRQAQTQLYTAQQEYLQTMLDIINAKAELESILNTPKINIDNQ
ncbi:MAG TPA: TolC family protein [Flavobacteriaceae bacterium]|nr:TolC family protein [Flavobacteriaceae bacterium]